MTRDDKHGPPGQTHPTPERPVDPRANSAAGNPPAGTAPLSLAITGASGAAYGVRLLAALNERAVPVRLMVSNTGWRLLEEELGLAGEADLRGATGDWSRVVLYDNADRGATPASGSAASRGMIICPCSMGTLASIAQGTTRSLIERAADVVLKERRPLILVPRETPYSAIHLENMLKLTHAGAVVLPASPGFYHQPEEISELVDFIVGRVLAHVGIDSGLGPRWQEGEP
jgi:4-hydroxy-3-polyprenylbenzoate decarboxylase